MGFASLVFQKSSATSRRWTASHGPPQLKLREPGANKLRDAIRAAAPVKRGILKKAIKAQVKTTHQGSYVSAAIVVDPEGSYWIPVEFGHSKGIDGKPVKPHPFVYPTRDRLLPEILREMEGALDEVFVAAGGG
jgi:hypothetical protein